MTSDQINGIRKAAKLLGSQLALSRALAVTPVTVSQWVHSHNSNGRPVPIKQCVRIEQLTQGQVSRRDLRPDDWQQIWPELADAPAADTTTQTETEQGATCPLPAGADAAWPEQQGA